MAIKTQLRLNQLTASFGGLLGPVLGDINDGGVNPGVENKAALADIAVVDLSGSLSYLATAIRRVHGGVDFSDQTAGEFSHAVSTFTGKILVGGDTAIGDDAALGYTAAEGLILAGQGSTSDVTIKNDADAAVLSIATGTTNVDIVGDLTAGTLNADGDTSADDNAAIGYTAAEGIIITGQGSTSDVTIKNDADALVMDIPTGTTIVNFASAINAASADVVNDLTAGNLIADSDTATGDLANIGYTAAEGIIITGQGSTNDITLKNDADAEVMGVLTGTTTALFAGKVLVSGDTAASDLAAVGYKAADGIIITGQGSTNDVTIKNDAAAEVMGVLTGTTTAVFTGEVRAASADITGDLTAGNLIADADVAVGDSANIGYTAADGLVLTGQGSSSDITIRNDAKVLVMSVPTGTANVAFSGDVDVLGGDLVVMAANDAAASLTLKADNSDDNGDDWLLGAAADQSFALMNDITGSPVAHFSIAPHATVANSVTSVHGKLKVGGNEIQAADGGSTITLNNSDLVTFAGDLDHANTAWTIGGSITTPATKITLGGGAAVEILGDLFVRGTEHIIDSDNLRIKDPLIAIAAGSKTANSNGGMAIISGSTTTLDMVVGRVANNTWGVGLLDTQSGSITSVSGMAVTNFRAGRLEIDTANDYIDVSTDMQLIAAADIVLNPGGNNVNPGSNDADSLGASGTAWKKVWALAVDVGDGNITNVGDISLDSISADGAALSIDSNWDAAGVTCSNLGTVSAATSVTSTDFVGRIGNSGKAAGTFTAVSVDSLTATANIDLGAVDVRAASFTADSLTSGRVPFASTNGLLIDDADFAFATDTLTVTKLGAYEQAGSVDFSDEIMTNVNIDSGAIDGTNVTVGAGKTLTVSAGTLATSAAQNLAIVQGAAANIDIGAYTLTGTQLISDIADGTAPLVVTSTTVVGNLNASTVAGQTMAIPGNIGGTTPSTATFTTITANTSVLPDANDGAALGAAGTAFSDLFLAEGGVINWDSGDVTLTQAGDLLTVAGGELRMDGAQKIEFGGNSNFINLSTNLKIVAAADIQLDAAGGDITMNSVGTNPFMDLNRAGAGEAYVNFSTNDGNAIGAGSGGFGFRNTAGTMQFKNSGGSWSSFGASAAASKTSTVLTGSIPSGGRLGIDGGFDMSSISGASQTNMVDVFVNGQMMLSGGTHASITNDYAVNVMSGNGSASDLNFNFALDEADVVTVTVR